MSTINTITIRTAGGPISSLVINRGVPGASITTSTTPPADTSVIWFDPETGGFSVWYVDAWIGVAGASAWADLTDKATAPLVTDNTGLAAALALKAPLVSPTFTTPALGAATATSVNKLTITPPATGATFTLTDGKTFAVNNTLTLAGTDGSTLNIGTGGTLGSAAYTASSAYAPVRNRITSTATAVNVVPGSRYVANPSGGGVVVFNETGIGVEGDTYTVISVGSCAFSNSPPHSTITIGGRYIIVSAGGGFVALGAANDSVGTVFVATGSGTSIGTAVACNTTFSSSRFELIRYCTMPGVWTSLDSTIASTLTVGSNSWTGSTFTGAQSFTGQVQLSAGQAATDAQSAMSRGLGDARYATAAQGTDERVPTAAGLTSKFSTADATVVDADRVAIFDSTASFVPKHALLSTLWTWVTGKIDTLAKLDSIVADATLARTDAGQTFTGAQAFSGSLSVTGNLAVDTNTLFVDAANNRVGVNTSSPTYPFEVRGALLISSAAAWAAGQTSFIYFGDSGASLTVAYSGFATWTTYNGIIFKNSGGANTPLVVGPNSGIGGTTSVGVGGNISVSGTTITGATLLVSSTSATLTGSFIASGTVTASNFKRGTGSPESVVTGTRGDIYTRTDGGAGTTLYVKETGDATNTGWVAK